MAQVRDLTQRASSRAIKEFCFSLPEENSIVARGALNKVPHLFARDLANNLSQSGECKTKLTMSKAFLSTLWSG